MTLYCDVTKKLASSLRLHGAKHVGKKDKLNNYALKGDGISREFQKAVDREIQANRKLIRRLGKL
jgi:hypothetical protein